MLSRRDMLKLAAALGLSGLPLPEMELCMNYGDILAKLGEGKKLDPAEIEFLRLEGNLAQSVVDHASRWTASGNLDAPQVSGQVGIFEDPPSHGIFMWGPSVTVPDATITYPSFTVINSARTNYGPVYVDPSDATKIRFNPVYNSRTYMLFNITLQTAWDTTTASVKTAVFYLRRVSDDVLLSGIALYSLNVAGNPTTVLCASMPFFASPTAYIQIGLRQYTGGDVDCYVRAQFTVI